MSITTESRKKMSDSRKKLHQNVTYHKKWKESLKKRPPMSKKQKENHSKAMSGKGNPNYGKPRSKETRKKIKESNIKTWSNPELRKRQRIYGWKTCAKISRCDTSIEKTIRRILQVLGIEFVKHKLISDIDHAYLCDVFIPEMNLVVECDGNYWHNYPNGNYIDHVRTKEMLDNGYKVLRLWESEIEKMTPHILRNKILQRT